MGAVAEQQNMCFLLCAKLKVFKLKINTFIVFNYADKVVYYGMKIICKIFKLKQEI